LPILAQVKQKQIFLSLATSFNFSLLIRSGTNQVAVSLRMAQKVFQTLIGLNAQSARPLPFPSTTSLAHWAN
jgi:hypothetical protein